MENFSWKPFYTELASKLLDYKDNRAALVKWIYEDLGKVTRDDGKSLVAYLKMKDGSKISDIDPFSVYGIFNRNASWDKRKELIGKFKAHFNLESEMPEEFYGVPTLDPRRAFFFSWYDDNDKVIHDQWELFEKIVKGEDAEAAFNQVQANGMARYSLTMCLFWIAPDRYLSLDSRNRAFLSTFDFPKDFPSLKWSEYMSLLDEVNSAMETNKIPCSSFLELSSMAWKSATETPRVWMWNGDENTFSQTTLKMGSSGKGLLDYYSYKTKEELGNAYRAVVGNTDVSIPYMYWEFMRNVKKGDIVVVFSTRKKAGNQYHLLYGWGNFISNCAFVEGENDPIQRNVEWHQPYLDTPIKETLTKNALYFHLLEGIEADNIIRLLNISKKKVSETTGKRNYWLVGYSFGSSNSQFARFIQNYIWEGRFDDDSDSDLKLLPVAQTIKKGDVLILKSTSTKGPKHDQAFLRVKAVAVVTEDIVTDKLPGTTSCICKVKYYGIEDHDFDNPAFASYRKTIHQADAKAQPIIEYANSLIDNVNMPKLKYKEYIDLLNENYNLILTGAPGTGKTYMAKAIAEEMGAEWEFVQFHPSYDYTDFVEGMRPVGEDGKFGFELRNGVFKDFCARAWQNIVDSNKSIIALRQESSARFKIDEYLEEAIETGKSFKTLGTKNNFKVIENNEKTIIVEVPANEKTNLVKLPKQELIALVENNVNIKSGKDMQQYFKRKHGTQQDAYVRVLYNAIKNYKPSSQSEDVTLIPKKKFVFIIDEINRGEISKIFGELFFSIDPGYRGTKGNVKTQYQNMVPEDDEFSVGFFVPRNVYIIGTMNDIDRSVESMDFAMRRRFAWREVTAEESMTMLDEMEGVSANELQILKNRMRNLNNAIAETEGLNEAYQIGAAYFLKYGKYHDFEKLWNVHLKGLLSEYLRGNRNAKEQLENLYSAYSKESVSDEENAADNQG